MMFERQAGSSCYREQFKLGGLSAPRPVTAVFQPRARHGAQGKPKLQIVGQTMHERRSHDPGQFTRLSTISTWHWGIRVGIKLDIGNEQPSVYHELRPRQARHARGVFSTPWRHPVRRPRPPALATPVLGVPHSVI